MGRYRRVVKPMSQDVALTQDASSAPTIESRLSSVASEPQAEQMAHIRKRRLAHASDFPPVMSWQLFVVSLLGGLSTLLAWNGRTQPDDWASLWIGGLLMSRGQEEHLYDAAPSISLR